MGLFVFVFEHVCVLLLVHMYKDYGIHNHNIFPGKAAKEKHMMPRGGMFDLLSCPHMFAEVLVYVGIMFVLWNHTEWLFVTTWVICNQVRNYLYGKYC